MLNFERDEHDEAMGVLRAALPPAELDLAWADGRALSVDAAGALAVAPVLEPR